MRICIVNEFFFPDNTGGTGTVLSDLARQLKDRHADVEIDVITSKNQYRTKTLNLPRRENWDGIEISRLSTPRPNGRSTPMRLVANLVFSVAALIRLLFSRRYDVVLVATAPPMVALAAYIYKRLTDRPYVYIIYDLEPDRSVAMHLLTGNHPAVRLFRYWQRRWLNNASKVVVLGRCMAERIAKIYDLPAEKIDIIPIGADASAILPASTETKFRHLHGLSGFVVLYSGNFGRYHNFDTVLDAAARLSASGENVQFVLVGSGVQERHIAARIENEKLENVRHFEFVSKDDYADLLASADVSLVTLEPGMEGLCVPSKLYSILASGRPIISLVSPRSEVARVINDAECGVQILQDDVGSLVTAIQAFTANKAECARMGRNARQALVERFETRYVVEKYYSTLVASLSPVGVATGAFHLAPPPEVVQSATISPAASREVEESFA